MLVAAVACIALQQDIVGGSPAAHQCLAVAAVRSQDEACHEELRLLACQDSFAYLIGLQLGERRSAPDLASSAFWSLASSAEWPGFVLHSSARATAAVVFPKPNVRQRWQALAAPTATGADHARPFKGEAGLAQPTVPRLLCFAKQLNV